MKKTGDGLKDLKDNINWTDICSIGIPEGEERVEQKSIWTNYA